jgi:hypothetical protein
MEIEVTVNFSGDSHKIMSAAMQALVSHQIKPVTGEGASTVQLRGPGAFGSGDSEKGQTSLRTISDATLSVTGSSISLHASMAGVERFSHILLLICLPADAILAVIVGLNLWKQNNAATFPIVGMILVGMILPWLLVRLISPRSLSRAVEKLLRAAVDAAHAR